jgi:NAD-dependent deacetylase
MATFRMFKMSPYEVWQWYLYRKTVCAQAKPNSGHLAIVELEKIFQDRFLLITQNVDGLHLRAGNTPDRTYQIHGNLNFMRCSDECSGLIMPIPNEIPFKDKTALLTETDKKLLVCRQCGAISRPHVLWFDECYDEIFFRFHSSLRKAEKTDLLLVVGTSGATNLPMQVGVTVVQCGGVVIDINPEPNPFSQMATSVNNGYCCSEKSSEALPQIVEFLRK